MAKYRADFPILSQKINGRPLAYLDTAASAQKPKGVIDAMTHAMETHYANIHRGLYALSQQTTAKVEAARAAEEEAKAARPNMFRKPGLDEMGTSGDHATPAGATSRSLFKKQSAAEAHGSDFGMPGDGGKSLFRKNTLDEMTVRRTEKPVEGVKPAKLADDPRPLVRARAGVGSYEDPSDQRKQGRTSRKTGRRGK